VAYCGIIGLPEAFIHRASQLDLAVAAAILNNDYEGSGGIE